jgi:hypothetical protein
MVFSDGYIHVMHGDSISEAIDGSLVMIAAGEQRCRKLVLYTPIYSDELRNYIESFCVFSLACL